LAQVFDNTQTGEAMTKRMIGGILLVSMVFLASGCATIGGAAVSTVTAIPDCANAIVANEDTSAGQKFFDMLLLPLTPIAGFWHGLFFGAALDVKILKGEEVKAKDVKSATLLCSGLHR